MKYLIALLSLVCPACSGCAPSSSNRTAPATPAQYAYACTPTPFTPGQTIMPLGDSITFGYGSTNGGGYRDQLAQDLGSAYTFVGSQVDPQGYHHEGHPGWTTKNESTQNGLYEQVDCWLGLSQPTAVLLMIGTNTIAYRLGMNPRANADLAVSDLQDLVNKIHSVSPRTKIYLASIIQIEQAMPWVGGNSALEPTFAEAIDMYDAELPGFVISNQNAGLDITFVGVKPLVTNTPSSYFDMVHPSNAGYMQIEDAWLSALTGGSI